ncbi:hypothetical protein N3K66_004405 [Trichothecium roseum]|uniref:Uncharacterized protein n=1 Tax=Trichothecium roseum TaxID=47278 RepID=A0ACC0V146_9HYPO|nr:hypothetical protein N3K66_004405 [Trichothecium roseum]
MSDTKEIPRTPGLLSLPNIQGLLFGGCPAGSSLAVQNERIFRTRIGTKAVVVLSCQEYINEAFDERRFHKSIKMSLGMVREGVHDGLFTAIEGEEAWGIAHRVLVPAFGPLPIRAMFDEMRDVATQLALKLARHGPAAPVLTTDDFTRLALDTLALCSMGYRFNSFYREGVHDFVRAMNDFLLECGSRNRRSGYLPDLAYSRANGRFAADIATMKRIAGEVLEARKKTPGDRTDLLTAMLDGVDRRTGKKLTDDNIINNLITFLIAGHETTSGMISFAFYQLLRHPEAYRKVQQEVDAVVGRGSITVEHLSKLPYTSAVLRETLRLSANIPSITVEPYEDTLIAGKYLVRKGEPVLCRLAKAHLDPLVYGDDAESFRPERMLDHNFARLNEQYPNCWKPFGNGKRGCIGRPFAWQEALLCISMLFQNFDFVMDDPGYKLEVVKTLTIKPGNFYIRASLRHGMTPAELERCLAGRDPQSHAHVGQSAKDVGGGGRLSGGKETQRRPLTILYGSNSGTCAAMAQRLAADAPSHGFRASTVSALDDVMSGASGDGNLPRDEPVTIITASYEGKPPSNAEKFVPWLEGLGPKALEGVNYAVFGCGHRDWTDTFHRIPTLVDAALEASSASRLVPLGTTDAAESDMFGDFEAWEDDLLWPALKARYGTGEEEEDDNADGETEASEGGLRIDISVPRKTALNQSLDEAVVLSERTLTAAPSSGNAAPVPVKKHLEVRLPPGAAYRPGDYLSVLPVNPKETIARVLRRFRVPWDASLRIAADQATMLPAGKDISVVEALGAYVELCQPATRKSILILARAGGGKQSTIEGELKLLAGDKFHEEISLKKVSVLDLLECYPSIHLPLGTYLGMLPPMRTRQYSISSSPLVDSSRATITYSVLDMPPVAAGGRHRHLGAASNFLASLRAGDSIQVSVRPCQSGFRLPSDRGMETTPLVLVAAGAGLAPFLGFIQERAALLSATTPGNNKKALAPALLFFGCRGLGQDDIYAQELVEWEALGAVTVRSIYSRAAPDSSGDELGYVQDRLYRDRKDVWALWAEGAKIYVCGSRRMGRGVEETFARIAEEEQGESGIGGKGWIESQKRDERFVTDIFD